VSDAERLLELLGDPAFRARFALDPEGTARALGLDALADDLARSAAPRLESLDRRESRSSLAGMLLATAAEAVAIAEIGGHLFGAQDAQAATLQTWNASEFGAHATGGPITPQVTDLVHDSNVSFDASGIADLDAGRIDPRLVSVLLDLSHEHKLVVSAMASDHGEYTANGSVSNHYYGRAVDLASVDGKPVDSSNEAAKAIAIKLSQLDPSIRPTEIGSPWALSGSAYFTDADHQNHLHIGFDDPITPNWRAPADEHVAAPAAPAAPAARSVGRDEGRGRG
jgi:hypothetical protein